MEEWANFATVAGAAAASLTGLLFVAVSIRIDVIAPNAVTSVLVLVSGVVIAAGVHAGLYVLVVPVVAALAGGVTSAWVLLSRIDA